MAKTKDQLVEEAHDQGVDVDPDNETKADIEAKLEDEDVARKRGTHSVTADPNVDGLPGAAASAEGGGAWPTELLLARQEAQQASVDVSSQYTSHEKQQDD